MGKPLMYVMRTSITAYPNGWKHSDDDDDE